MYISRIRLNNIRGFKDFDLSITDADGVPRMNTTIIGKNGTNKTTLLRCIVLGLCERPQANALLAEEWGRLISIGSKTASILIEMKGGKGHKKECKIQTRIKKDDDSEIVYRQDRSPKNFESSSTLVCGYGVARSQVGPSSSGRGYQITDSTYTLFNYESYIRDPEVSFRRLQDYIGGDFFDRTMDGIKSVLGLTKNDSIKVEKGGGLYLTGPSVGKKIYLEEWADGYSLTFDWILDFYSWAIQTQKINSDGKIDGILIVDEPEQHTHPSMQMGLLRNLSKLLPDVQFFSATHSPLIALSMGQEDLVVLKRKGKTVEVENDIPDYLHFSTEDMLTDEKLFEADAFRPEHIELVKERDKISSMLKSKRTTKQNEKLLSISTELSKVNKPGVKKSNVLADIELLRKKYSL